MTDAFEAVRVREGFAWPNGARLAVMLCSEYEPVYAARPLPGGQVDHRHQAEMRYEATSGLPRILKILERHEAPATFFVNGGTAEQYPKSVATIAARGHEVAAHSWNAMDHFRMERADEDELIGRTVGVLEQVTGTRPAGWLSPRAQVSDNTVELIVQHGFRWHGDCYDDDLPYAIDVKGSRLVEIPRSATTDDFGLMGGHMVSHFNSHRNVLASWLDEFDVLYNESATEPRLFTVTWHQCRLGRPGVSKVLDELLTHIRHRPGIWFARGNEIASCFLP